MAADLNFETISDLVNSWDSIRKIQGYEETIGCMLLEKLYRIDPNILVLFGFPQNVVDHPQNMEDFKGTHRRRFLHHARHIVRMMDSALSMVGPDTDQMTDLLVKQGQKHAKYGIQPVHYEIMGRAWMDTVKEILFGNDNKNNFTTKIEWAWQEFYGAMAYDMIQAQNFSQ